MPSKNRLIRNFVEAKEQEKKAKAAAQKAKAALMEACQISLDNLNGESIKVENSLNTISFFKVEKKGWDSDFLNSVLSPIQLKKATKTSVFVNHRVTNKKTI